MYRPGRLAAVLAITVLAGAAGCSSGPSIGPNAATGSAQSPSSPTSTAQSPLDPAATGSSPAAPLSIAAVPKQAPRGGRPGSVLTPPGNSSGAVALPAVAQAVDTTHPTRVIGSGTPATCTSAAVVAAVAAGGIITFSCGPAPVTISMTATAKVVNTSAQVVLDGAGLVTLSGGGARRIVYMDTCDQAQIWTTSHCNNQPSPQLVLQNLTFTGGNSTGQTTDGGGGGAVFARGGRVKVVNSRFVGNRCEASGPDIGGAAIRVLDQSDGQPVYIVGSTFTGNICSNGGGLSSIGVSWVVLNCVFSNNQAIGSGANPAAAGTPGGGSGAAIYTDGNTYTVSISGTAISGNHANEGGGAIFFVSNDRTGSLTINQSQLSNNPNDGFQTAGLPGIFFLGAHPPTVTASTIK